VFVILCASVVSAQQYYVSGQQYYSYSPQPQYYSYSVPRYYQQPTYYDYGTGRYVSASERAWLDRRTEAVFTGRGWGAPLWARGLRLWVNTH
jgi:hypothetical protein